MKVLHRFRAWLSSLVNPYQNLFSVEYPNSDIIKLFGTYRKGKRIGTWTWYDENGNKIKETKYSDNGQEIYTWYAQR